MASATRRNMNSGRKRDRNMNMFLCRAAARGAEIQIPNGANSKPLVRRSAIFAPIVLPSAAKTSCAPAWHVYILITYVNLVRHRHADIN